MSDNVHTIDDLRMMQALPLSVKLRMTETRIRQFVQYYGEDGVYIAFSGGKDSTVLLHIVRGLYPNIPAVFSNTGLEYPEIQKFVKTKENAVIIRPEESFSSVIKKYGYPFIGKRVASAVDGARRYMESVCKESPDPKSDEEWLKRVKEDLGKATGSPYKFASFMGFVGATAGEFDANGGSLYNFKKYKPLLFTDFKISARCCDLMKKSPMHKYGKSTNRYPIMATMADESELRTKKWLKSGCNIYDATEPQSMPMSFWTEGDVLQYAKENGIEIASVYGDIVCESSDGMQYEQCLTGDCKYTTTGCKRTGCIFCGFGAHLEKGDGRFVTLKKTHPNQYDYCMGGGGYDPEDGYWKPTKEGLGMAHCIDELCRLYGKDFIKY